MYPIKMGITRLCVLCLLLAYFFPLSSMATTIVIVRLEEGVFIGADSDGTVYDSKRRGSFHTNVCKILPAGNLYFAVSGLSLNENTKFSIPKIAQKTVSARRSLEQNADAVAQRLISPLLSELYWSFKHSPAKIRDILREKQPLSSIVFVGVERGVPKFSIRNFYAAKVDKKWRIAVESFRCPGDCGSAQYTAYMGKSNAIRKFLAGRKGAAVGTPAETINILIQQEIAAGTPGVNGPVDILKINWNGSRTWLQRKSECRNR